MKEVKAYLLDFPVHTVHERHGGGSQLVVSTLLVVELYFPHFCGKFTDLRASLEG